jgi:hypothetical protein
VGLGDCRIVAQKAAILSAPPAAAARFLKATASSALPLAVSPLAW